MNEIIKMKRLEKNMSLEEVGKLVGVGKSTVRKGKSIHFKQTWSRHYTKREILSWHPLSHW